MIPDFETRLDHYAELAVRVGLNLQPGQRVVVLKANLETAPFVRRLAAKAYQAGARFVDVMWGDDELNLARFKYAPADSFDEFQRWKGGALLEYAQAGDAIVSVRGEDPDLMRGQNPDHLGAVMKNNWQQLRPTLDITGANGANWLVIAAPVAAWAAKVFPDLPAEARVDSLWELLFKFCRVDQPDPILAWQRHLQELAARRDYMNHKRYAALHYTAPGTDLRVGLPSQHLWVGGSSTTTSGIVFTPNLPTEEIFNLPHRDQVDGVVRASMPLSYGGALIQDFSLNFERGRVVNLSAASGEEVLRKLVETDEGAGRLGEVALVPDSTPLAQARTILYDGLLDENAASHLALGKAYRINLIDGETMDDDAFTAAGANNSLVHVDFMIGSGHMDIDGITSDGQAEPVMRGGEWAFQV